MINFEDRLRRLKDRRQGSRERAAFETLSEGYARDSAIARGIDFRQKESYEALKEPNGIKYAIGAMAPVSKESTQKSISEGERVATTLVSMLSTENIKTTCRLQGSVALDIHIEGHSDVDMLILLESTILVERPEIPQYVFYPAADKRSMADIVAELRTASEKKLTSRYWQAEVNCNGNKSISLSGGSLQRKIDIVPSCWHDNHAYQTSKKEHDRGVYIYHKGNHQLEGNLPFTHIKKVNDRDLVYEGNLKKVIRLLKNIVADIPEYKKTKAKKLSSYDIAAIAYHMNGELKMPNYMSLGLVEKTRTHLANLVASYALRSTLEVPDGTRKIFDSEEKVTALEILEKEVTDLATSIAKEINPYLNSYNSTTINQKFVFI